MLNLHLLECTVKGYDHISDLLLAKYWVITGCKYGVCSYWHYGTEGRAILDDFLNKDWLITDDHLLSSFERDYFSYYLDNMKYTNGMAYRNHYMHGSTLPIDDEKEHETAYLTILKLLTILI